MADEALLYDRSDSPFCLKARICLQLKGVPFRRVTVTVGRLRELRRLNPLRQVPVLVQGADVIADSSAIARHLEAIHPEPSLLPADPTARAYALLVEEWADEALGFLVGALKWLNPENRAAALANNVTEMVPAWLGPVVAPVVLHRERRRYRASGHTRHSLGALRARMRENLAVLTSLLADRPFLVGRSPSLADLAAFAQLVSMRRYAEARLLEEAPVVNGWLDRLEAVPAIGDALPA